MSEGVAEENTDLFENNLICGEGFLELSESDLKELAPVIGTRLKLRAILKKAKVNLMAYKHYSHCRYFVGSTL